MHVTLPSPLGIAASSGWKTAASTPKREKQPAAHCGLPTPRRPICRARQPVLNNPRRRKCEEDGDGGSCQSPAFCFHNIISAMFASRDERLDPMKLPIYFPRPKNDRSCRPARQWPGIRVTCVAPIRPKSIARDLAWAALPAITVNNLRMTLYLRDIPSPPTTSGKRAPAEETSTARNDNSPRCLSRRQATDDKRQSKTKRRRQPINVMGSIARSDLSFMADSNIRI